MADDLLTLQDSLGYGFGDRELLLTAVTHPSYAAERKAPFPDNQRLEFLGDAVLQMSMSELVFQRFPEMNEGQLTKVRSSLTNAGAIVGYARTLGLGATLRLGKGEERANGRERPSNLGDAFEAVLAAIFLDGGMAPARELCRRLVESALLDAEQLMACENPKGALQELVQERHGTTPDYQTVEVTGPEHLPVFSVRVLIDGQEYGNARAGSRKHAEKMAAEAALAKLREA